MNLIRQKGRIERRMRFAGEWKPRDAEEAENWLFDRSFALAEVAHELEVAAGTPGSASATAASLGCATSALESIANATLKMRGALVEGSDGDGIAGSDREELAMLLHAIGQNVKMAAGLAERGRQIAAEAQKTDLVDS